VLALAAIALLLWRRRRTSRLSDIYFPVRIPSQLTPLQTKLGSLAI
jgi:hypothetical protein